MATIARKNTKAKEGKMMNPAKVQPNEGEFSGRFAVRLRKLREQAGLNVEAVVASIEKHNKSGRSSPKLGAVYSWEQGRATPHMDLFPAIAKALKVSVRDLLPEK